MDVNRIIQVDADSLREEQGGTFLELRYVYKTDAKRSRQPNPDPNLTQDMCVFTHALACIVLQAEDQGDYKVGEAISMVVNELQRIYVDARMEIKRDQLKAETFNTVSIRRTDSGF
jgi:hypothetical protein